MQSKHLILNADHHQGHHDRPHNRNYGITNGWTNPIVRALRFYEILEWTVTTVTGILPQHRKMSERMAKPRPAAP